MPDQLVPTVLTPVTPVGFARAVLELEPGWSKEAVGVLYAQYALETGAGKACWNWNLGNVKWTKGCGYDYIALAKNREADASGRYYETAKSDPASWFRAYPSFVDGMRAFVRSKTSGQWASVLPFILAGDVDGFAAELRRHRYYTAPLADYQAGMRAHFARWMQSGAWEEATAPVEPAPDTEPVLVPSMRPDPTRTPGFSTLDYDPDAPLTVPGG